jgi:hypothetical protein
MKVQIGGSQLPLFALVRWRAVRVFVVVGEGLAIGLVARFRISCLLGSGGGPQSPTSWLR